MLRLFDRVRDVTTTTGTGDLTLAGTPPLRTRTFASVLAQFAYTIAVIEHDSANEWEVCLAQLSAATTLRRVLVLSSSNADAPVNFSAGNKSVYIGDAATLAGLDPAQVFRTDWEGISTGVTDPFTSQISGTGAANNAFTTVLADDAVGVIEAALGTTATGRAAIASPNVAIMNLGNGPAWYSQRMRLANLSDATNTYTLRAGFLDSVSAEPTDGVFFRYTHGTNGGRWQAVARSNGVETGTALDTGVAAQATTWSRFDILVESGTRASFYINNARVAEATANIPVATGRELGWGKATIRSAGTAAFSSDRLDYIRILQFFTGGR